MFTDPQLEVGTSVSPFKWNNADARESDMMRIGDVKDIDLENEIVFRDVDRVLLEGTKLVDLWDCLSTSQAGRWKNERVRRAFGSMP